MGAHRVRLAAAALVMLPLTMSADRGGWSVFTVESLSEYLLAGEPVALSFSVRQHGIALSHGS